MMDTFAQILDEAFWGLNAIDSIEAMAHFEAIMELANMLAESLEAVIIPQEVMVV